MTTRIGLAVAHDSLRAVLVRGNRLIWEGEVDREPGAPFSEAIVKLLADAPLPRWPRPVLAAAVGPHACQVKRLEGLPPVDDAEVLAAIVRARPSAFFLQNGVPLRTTGVHVAGDGSAWAAAIDAPHVDDVRHACAVLRIKLSCVAPTAVVLPLAVRGRHLQRADGPFVLAIETAEGRLLSVRRLAGPLASPADPLETLPALDSLGERSERYAEAYGAAVAAVGDPLTLGPAGDVPWNRYRLRKRLLPPALLGSIAALALLLSPFAPLVSSRSAEASLREIQASEEWRLTVEVQAQLQRVTSLLGEVERFTTSRPQRLRLLSGLSRMLPDSAAIERLEIRGQEVRLTVVATHASTAVSTIRGAPDVESITLVGEVTRVMALGRELERVTMTIKYRDSPPHDAHAEAAP